MRSDATNYVRPDYFGKEFRYHDPQVDNNVETYYGGIRWVANHNRHAVLNTTVRGRLEVFKREACFASFPEVQSSEETDRINAEAKNDV